MHPWWTSLGLGWLPPHPFFETLAFTVGAWTYRRARAADPVRSEPGFTWVAAAGAVLGAAFGAQLLAIVQNLPAFTSDGPPPGRTIVGGIVGGWLGVEAVKKFWGVSDRTGDAFVPALVVGIGLGRLGCFFAGVEDGTHGNPSNLPWAMDLGDGVRRHPAALYEIAFVALFGLTLGQLDRSRLDRGDLFRLFVYGYLSWRAIFDQLKPAPWMIWDMTPIQLFCLVTLAVMMPSVRRIGHKILENRRESHGHS